MIVVDALVKSFGKHRQIKAVDGASFRADDGRITGLLGPNGAGKTTLLRMLATLIPPDAGQAMVDGLNVAADRYAVRRQIGVLSDARGLYGRLTARENVHYYGRLHGVSGCSGPELTRECCQALSACQRRDGGANQKLPSI